jgi:TolA-binding protein
MRTRAYEKAIESLDKIENKDTRTKEAYQIVSFNRGVELFQAQEYERAEEFFVKVNRYPVNASFTAEALFWRAELAYQKKEYAKSANLYAQFMQEPGAYLSEFYNEGNYGAGYALFNQQKYVSASTAFRKYVDQFKGDDLKKKGDALLRVGDCYYVTKDYNQAIAWYDKAIQLNQQMTDYARYQKAVCMGLAGNNDGKISVLSQLIDNEIDSRYVVDAKYELAKTHLQRDNLGEAQRWYDIILREHPNSPFVKFTLLDMCLIYVKQDNNPKVIEYWNRIKIEYPNDKVTIDAFNLVESVLLEEGLMDELPTNLGLSNTDIEARVFGAAADPAITGDCSKAIPKLEDYLRKYQPGLYAVQANYYLASCYFQQGNQDKALESYNFVIAQPVSDFTEESLVAAATINFNRKNYDQALNMYIELETVARLDQNVLEAQIGQMRCHYLLGQKNYALEYAERVIANSATPADFLQIAQLWKGRILNDNGDIDNAYYAFVEADKRGGVRGAEAKYSMAEIAYKKAAYKPAETEIFQLIEKYSAFEEWKFKGFLLLADVYVGLEDYFQARTTLNTILANVNVDWVIQGANERLARLESIENGQPQQRSQSIEIDLTPESDN